MTRGQAAGRAISGCRRPGRASGWSYGETPSQAPVDKGLSYSQCPAMAWMFLEVVGGCSSWRFLVFGNEHQSEKRGRKQSMGSGASANLVQSFLDTGLAVAPGEAVEYIQLQAERPGRLLSCWHLPPAATLLLLPKTQVGLGALGHKSQDTFDGMVSWRKPPHRVGVGWCNLGSMSAPGQLGKPALRGWGKGCLGASETLAREAYRASAPACLQPSPRGIPPISAHCTEEGAMAS